MIQTPARNGMQSKSTLSIVKKYTKLLASLNKFFNANVTRKFLLFEINIKKGGSD